MNTTWLINPVKKGKKPKKVKNVRRKKMSSADRKAFAKRMKKAREAKYKKKGHKVSKGVSIMAYKKKSRKKSVSHKVYKKKHSKRKGVISRPIAVYDGSGALRVSRKSRVARKGLKINPFKMSTKNVMSAVKPVALTAGVGLLSAFAITKSVGYIPVVKDWQSGSSADAWKLALSKVGLGVIGFIVAQKLIKKPVVSSAILLGGILGGASEYINLDGSKKTLTGFRLGGVNALELGRPASPLGFPQTTLGGLRIPKAPAKSLGAMALTAGSRAGVSANYENEYNY